VASTASLALQAKPDLGARSSALILIIFVLTLGVNVFLIERIPKGFFPLQDTGVIQGGMQGRRTRPSTRCKSFAAVGQYH